MRPAETKQVTDGGEPDADAASSSTCGSSASHVACESVAWPRLIVGFGNPAAKELVYTVASNTGVSEESGPCPSGYGESSAIHCDVGFYAGDKDTEFTLHVRAPDAGADIATRRIALRPFNLCGNGAAYVVVTSTAQGTVEIGDVRYVDVCGL